MQEEPEDISTKDYAKALTAIVTLVFWAFCILIGYNIINDNKAAAVIFLLILGFCLPIVVRAVIGLIQEKHSGQELDAREIATPAAWGGIFILVFTLSATFLPNILSWIWSL